MNQRLGIRWKVTIPIVLAVLLVLGFLPITNSVVNGILEEDADDRLQQTGQSAAALLVREEESQRLSAQFIAGLTSVESFGDAPSFEAVDTVFQARKAELGVQELSYYLANFEPGNPAYYYGGPPVVRRLQVSEDTIQIRDGLLVAALETGEAQSGIAIAPQSSQIIGVAPVRGDMGEGGIIGLVMSITYLNDEYMQDFSTILDAQFAIVKDNAVIVSTIDSVEGLENILQTDFVTDGVAARNIETEDGEPRRLLSAPLILEGQTQGSILISRNVEEIFDVRDQIQNLIFFAAGLIAAMGLLAVGATIANFVRPIHNLAEATNQIAGGELNRRVDVTHLLFRDEITDLGENFNTMAERVENLLSSLERRVKERTAELVEEQDKLKIAMNELALVRDEALAANRAKSVFLANMSHELRTPLNAIIGYTDLVLSGIYGETTDLQQERLTRVIDNGHHLLALINDVLDLSKIEAGRMELFVETFDVQNVISTVHSTAQPLAFKNGNNLVLDVDDDIGTMKSDMTKVQQILTNLLSNSAKFTKDGTITLSARRTDDRITFRVKDNGIGMTPEQADQIFEDFTQADASTTREYGGTGLGLAITKRFCEMMGGSIDVETTLDVGTTFTVVLPVVVEMLEEPTIPRAQTRTPAEIAEQYAEDDVRPILVIDDDEDIRDLMREYLTQSGYEVVTASSGPEGLSLAQEINPCLITLDVMMPEMDGWDVLTKIKENEGIGDIPVVMLTMVDNKNMGYALGASEYLLKPIKPAKLREITAKYACLTTPCSILLVEDNVSTREMVRDLLVAEGWHVTQAVNGRDGLAKIGEAKPQLILLDLMMPEMDGFEFLSVIRNDSHWRDIPVIVITAMTLSQQDRLRLEGNVQRILQKGAYDRERLLEELLRQIRSALNQPEQSD